MPSGHMPVKAHANKAYFPGRFGRPGLASRAARLLALCLGVTMRVVFWGLVLVSLAAGCAQPARIRWSPFITGHYRPTVASAKIVRPGDMPALALAGALKVGEARPYIGTPAQFRAKVAERGGTHALLVSEAAGQHCRTSAPGLFGSSTRCRATVEEHYDVFRVPPEKMGLLPPLLRVAPAPAPAKP